MLSWLLFWFILTTGSRLAPHDSLQKIVDTNEWIYVSDLGTWKWCSEIRYVASHNFNKLWKKIAALKVWQIINFDGCRYKAISMTSHEIKTYDTRQLLKNNWTLRLQTCMDDSNKWTRLVQLKNIPTRKLTIK